MCSNGSISVLVRLEAEHDVAVHLHEAAVAVLGEALVAGLARSGPLTVASLRPMLRTVSIMPGMDAGAGAARDEQRVFGSPNLAPMTSSTSCGAPSTWAFSSGG